MSTEDENITKVLENSLLQELEGDELQEIEMIFNEGFMGNDPRYPSQNNVKPLPKATLDGILGNEQKSSSHPEKKLNHKHIYCTNLSPRTPVKSAPSNTQNSSLIGRSLLMSPVASHKNTLNAVNGIRTPKTTNATASCDQQDFLRNDKQHAHFPDLELQKRKPTVLEQRKSQQIQDATVAKGITDPNPNPVFERYASPHQRSFMNYLSHSMGTLSDNDPNSPKNNDMKKTVDEIKEDDIGYPSDIIRDTKEVGTEICNKNDAPGTNCSSNNAHKKDLKSPLEQIQRKESLLKSSHQNLKRTNIKMVETAEQLTSGLSFPQKTGIKEEFQGNDSQSELQKLLCENGGGKYVF